MANRHDPSLFFGGRRIVAEHPREGITILIGDINDNRLAFHIKPVRLS